MEKEKKYPSTDQTKTVLIMLDEWLHDSCKASLDSKDYWNLVNCATRHLEVRIRKKAGLNAKYVGIALINKAFNPNDGRLIAPFCETVTEAEGFAHILRGITMFHRNAKAHREGEIEKERAFQIVNYIDYLIDLIGSATSRPQ